MDAAPPQIWDGVRKRWLNADSRGVGAAALDSFFGGGEGAFAACVSQERPVELAGRGNGADVTVTGRDGRICLVAECKSSARPARRAGARPGGTLQQRAGGSFHIGYERAAACLLPARCGIGALLPYCRIPDLSPFFGFSSCSMYSSLPVRRGFRPLFFKSDHRKSLAFE